MRPCRICGGSGIVYNRTPEAGSHGDLALCSCIQKKCSCGGIAPYQAFDAAGNHEWCACRSARTKLIRVKKAFKDSQIPKRYLWKFTEDFRKVNPVAEKICGLISGIRDEILAKGFYFWGPAGSGKTLLACITLQELMLKYGLEGKFVDISRQFFQRLKNTYDTTGDNEENAGDVLDELIRVPFLVIDDFGVQRNTEWESEMLYNLVDSRYEREHITIITSNVHIKDFSSVAYGRIHSRIKEMCSIIHVDLPDYRELSMKEFNFAEEPSR